MAIIALKLTTVKPLGDRILIKVSVPEEQTEGGILLPDTAKEKPQIGEVIAIGPGSHKKDGSFQPIDVKVGDRVLYSKYGGTDMALDNEDYVLVSEKDLLATLA